MNKTLIFIFIWIAFGPFVSNAQVYVNINATGNNDGSSWSNAYTNLNDALNDTTSSPGTEIWIAAGVYSPPSSNTPFVNKYGFSIYGGFTGTESSKSARSNDPWTNRVVLTADIAGNDLNDIPSASSVHKSDNADIILKIEPDGSNLNYKNAIVFIDRIDFENAYNGHALYSRPSNGHPSQKQITLTYCRFKHNYGQTRPAFDIWSNFTAGVNNYAKTFELLNCIIDENVSVIGLAFEYRNLNNRQIVNILNNLFIANSVESSTDFGSVGRFIIAGGSQLYVNFVNNTLSLNQEGSNITPNSNYSPIKLEVVSTNTVLKGRWYNNIYFSNFRSLNFYTSNSMTNAYILSSDKNAIDSIPQYSTLNNSVNLNGSPFVDINNMDFTPISAYRNIGAVNGYNQNITNKDCFANNRFTSTQIGLGAIQYNSGSMFTGPGDIASNSTTSTMTKLYVDAAATGNNDGSSWADAFTSLTSALSYPQISQISKIYVKNGIYKPVSGTYNITTDGLEIYGGFNGTETDENDRDLAAMYNQNGNESVIEGDVNGDDIYGDFLNYKTDNIERFFDISANNVKIDGFLMQNAYKASGSNPIISFTGTQINGFTLSNCVVRNNYSNGIFMEFRTLNQNVNFLNVKIADNYTDNGMMLLQGKNSHNIVSKFVNFSFVNNHYNSDFGAIWFRRVPTSNLNTTIVNSTFSDNVNDFPGYIRQLINISTNTNYTNFLYIYNSIFWQNYYTQSSSTVLQDRAVDNTKVSEGSNFYIEVDHAIIPPSYLPNHFNYDNVSNSDPQLNSDYAPTANSDSVINQGNAYFYDITAFGSLDLTGNARLNDSIIDLGAIEYQSTSAAIKKVPSLEFGLYPNPVQSTLYIKVDNIERVEVYDMLGRNMMTINNSNQIDMSSLSNGVYIVKVYANNKSGFRRIIKK
jgi:hypothetical protein